MRWVWIGGGALGAAALVAAVAVPNLIEARRHGNEAAAIGALKTITTAQSLFREGDKECDLDFDFVNQPVLPATTGDRYFCTNQAGVVYYAQGQNPTLRPVGEGMRSTFGVDVDTASYAVVRACLERGEFPHAGDVRVEELLNTFRYEDAQSTTAEPVSIHTEVGPCMWAPEERLVRIALKAKEVSREERPAANLVFLVDVSGSMDSPDRLPLVKRSLALLTRQLGADDRVAIVVYAGASGLALQSTAGDRHDTIRAALDTLRAGGSTAGGSGIELAYRVAQEGWLEDGVNRVILLTDGDFNLGPATREELETLIAEQAKSNVFLTAVGFGTSHNDSALEGLADRGNGTYAYVDDYDEARKVFLDELCGTLLVAAKDVKVQVEFDPRNVETYRLIGYENRVLENRDFEDDTKDAGDMGAGHSVTAFYQVKPTAASTVGAPLLSVRVRYKLPYAEQSQDLVTERRALDVEGDVEAASADFRFASAVAAFGQLLRGSSHVSQVTFEEALQGVRGSLGRDPGERRAEFAGLVERAIELRDAGVRAPVADAGVTRGGFDYGSLAELSSASLIDGILGSGVKQGYSFDLHVSPEHPEFMWILTASPREHGTTGDRYFVTNHLGVVYYSSEGPFQVTDDCKIPLHAIPIGK